nr:MAG TPA: hypothetical protein [Caudoviricetes sp.]
MKVNLSIAHLTINQFTFSIEIPQDSLTGSWVL